MTETTQSLTDAYTAIPWPQIRELVVDFLSSTQPVHALYGTAEGDIDLVLKKLNQYKLQLNGHISLTAYLVYCLAHNIETHKMMHAYRHGKKLILFDDVDVNTLLEKRKPDGTLVPVAYIVRGANHKSLAQINHELQMAKYSSLSNDKGVKRRAQLLKLPTPIRRMLGWRVRRNAFLLKEYWGTVSISNVGAFLPGRPFWGTAQPFHTSAITVGGIYERVCWGENGPEPRQKIILTLATNHDIVDGAPATRFASTLLSDWIEVARGLDEDFLEEAQHLLQDSPLAEQPDVLSEVASMRSVPNA